MDEVSTAPSGQAVRLDKAWLAPALALLGLLLLTAHDLADGIWRKAEHGYQPLLVWLAGMLLFFDGRQLRWQPPEHPSAATQASFGFGLLAYALGRSQGLELLEALACTTLIAALVGYAGGRSAWQGLRLAILLLLLALPYPAWVIDTLTAPLKLGISQLVEGLLHATGYPVARSGVVLALGPYRLLVADACSGLHSLIFLLALGLLYLHLGGPRRRWHHAILVISLLPIALLANGLRVLALALTTYHLGDQAGQGLWHEFSGLLLFACAMLTLFALDALLASPVEPAHHPDRPPAPTPIPRLASARRQRIRSWLLAASLAGSGLLAQGLQPQPAPSDPHPELASLIPQQFADWKQELHSPLTLIAPDARAEQQRLYEQTLARVYQDERGERIMLSVAYGRRQRGNELQAHRPEYCYLAQGFEIRAMQDSELVLANRVLPLRQLLAVQPQRSEPISYWMTVGDQPTLPGIGRKWLQLRFGLQGVVPDGLLVRISSLDRDSARAHARQQRFINDLVQAAPELVGWQPGTRNHSRPAAETVSR